MADPPQNPAPNLRIEGLIVFEVQRMGNALGIFLRLLTRPQAVEFVEARRVAFADGGGRAGGAQSCAANGLRNYS